MDFFQKVTDFAKVKIQEQKERMDKEKALDNLTKDQLLELAVDHGVPISRGEAKEDMISSLASCKELTVKDIMKKALQKTKTKEIISKNIKRKVKEEDIEVEQEIERTEKIRTTIKKKTKEIEFDAEVSKIVGNFEPIIKKDMKEKDVEGQLVQSLRAIIPKEKVDYQQRGRSGRADIVIGRDIAIELKLISGSSQLMALKGQLHSYSKEYDKLYVWMYDLNNVLKHQTLDTFKKELNEMGIKNTEVVKRP